MRSLTTSAPACVKVAGRIPIEITYTAAGHGYVNAEVMKHIDEVADLRV